MTTAKDYRNDIALTGALVVVIMGYKLPLLMQ